MKIKFFMLLPLLFFISIGSYAQTPQTLQRLKNKYDYVGKFKDSLAVVNMGGSKFFGRHSADGRFGFVDHNGEVVVPLIYDYADDYLVNGFAMVGKGVADNRKFGLIDRCGQEIVKCVWDNVSGVHEGVAVAWNGSTQRTYSMIDTLGHETKLPYDYCDRFHNGLAIVGVGNYKGEKLGMSKDIRLEFVGKKGFIDKDANVVIPLEYDDVKEFHNGLAPVGKQGKYYIKWGVINKNGETVIPFNYYDVGYFRCNDLAMICKVVAGGKLAYGYIDKSGTEVIPCTYDFASDFEFDNTWVGVSEGNDTVYCLIDKTGTALIGFKVYDLDDSGKYGHSAVATKDVAGKLRYGIVDNRGRVVVPLEYDHINIFSEWNESTGQWDENGMAEKDGENYSFVMRRK